MRLSTWLSRPRLWPPPAHPGPPARTYRAAKGRKNGVLESVPLEKCPPLAGGSAGRKGAPSVLTLLGHHLRDVAGRGRWRTVSHHLPAAFLDPGTDTDQQGPGLSSEAWAVGVSSVLEGRGQDPPGTLGLWPGFLGSQLSPQVARSPGRHQLCTVVERALVWEWGGLAPPQALGDLGKAPSPLWAPFPPLNGE